MDFLKAKDEIASLVSDLSQMQADIDARHTDHLYTEAANVARSISVQLSMTRVVQTQVYWANAPTPSLEDYYKVNFTRVFLEHSLQQLNA